MQKEETRPPQQMINHVKELPLGKNRIFSDSTLRPVHNSSQLTVPGVGHRFIYTRQNELRYEFFYYYL